MKRLAKLKVRVDFDQAARPQHHTDDVNAFFLVLLLGGVVVDHFALHCADFDDALDIIRINIRRLLHHTEGLKADLITFIIWCQKYES